MHLLETVHNEEARLNALRDLKLLDTPPSESFDRLTRMASQLLSMPVSTISLTDNDRQWFKSRFGVALSEIPRDKAPCNYAIRGAGILVVPDLKEDPRFADSPLVAAGIRFYAGAPLFTRAGHGLGTLCVVDVEPRQIDSEQQRVLKDLAGMVMSQIELQNMIGRIDPTSGLPNQHQLLEDLAERAARDPDATVSLVMAEFISPVQARKQVRALGASCTDDFAGRVMARLQAHLGNASCLYHVGPMRSAILIGELAAEAQTLVAALSATLESAIDCAGVPITPDPAFGTYAYAAATVQPRDALRRLAGACDDAREAQVLVADYSPAQDARHARSFALLNDFAVALRGEGQLALAYQPRVGIASGELIGAEALLRWTHPQLGPISPGEFVPMVEQTALARPMTDWVARTALARVQAWRQAGLDFTVSINASALNLDERDFASRLLRAVDDAGVDTRSMELEFTESAVARDTSRVAEQLAELKRQGIAIAIDDFGTGYSNLAYIQQLPVSVLKIDRSFITNLTTSRRDRTLVRSMITMAHDLGYRVVAEGIETREVLDLLAEFGCDEAQGFFIARPMPAAEMSLWKAPVLAA